MKNPPKTNECPLKNAGWKDYFPRKMLPFLGDMLVFRGGYCFIFLPRTLPYHKFKTEYDASSLELKKTTMSVSVLCNVLYHYSAKQVEQWNILGKSSTCDPTSVRLLLVVYAFLV